MYFRTGLGALCKALGPWQKIGQQDMRALPKDFCDRMIAFRKNLWGARACLAGRSFAVGPSTFAILIARDEKEQNRMMLHHTEQYPKILF